MPWLWPEPSTSVVIPPAQGSYFHLNMKLMEPRPSYSATSFAFCCSVNTQDTYWAPVLSVCWVAQVSCLTAQTFSTFQGLKMECVRIEFLCCVRLKLMILALRKLRWEIFMSSKSAWLHSKTVSSKTKTELSQRPRKKMSEVYSQVISENDIKQDQTANQT